MNFLRKLYIQLRYNVLITFMLGALSVWVLEKIAELFLDIQGPLGVLGIIAAAVVAVLLYQVIMWSLTKLSARELEPPGTPPDARKGLILLISNKPTASKALEFHQGRLEYVWFIVTDDTETLAKEMEHYLISAVPFQEEVSNPYSPIEAGNAVDRALSHALVLNLTPDQIICDVTGGTKAMTVGAMQACVESNLAMQMVPARFNKELKAVEPLGVIELEFTIKPPLLDSGN